MKEFNLKEAKAGKKVRTLCGYKARIICFDADNKHYPIIALVNDSSGEVPIAYTKGGKYYGDFDLMDLKMED